MIDIEKRFLKLIRDILKEHVPEMEVWAFGSRVDFTSKPTSDLDLVLITDSGVPFEILSKLKVDFSESDLPFMVDVIDWSELDTDFQNIIKNNYVIIKHAHTQRLTHEKS